MRSEPDPAGERLWATVAATVRPLPGRVVPLAKTKPAAVKASPDRSAARAPGPPSAAHHPVRPPQAIEPRRRHRLEVGREGLAGRLDLHGLDQDRARRVLTEYILRCHAEGRRAVLVITGKGVLGAGVLRRHVPEWLAAPPLRGVVAGLAEAHRRHGGEGALYVAVRRQADPRRARR